MTMEEAIPMDRLAKVYLKIRNQIQLLTQDYEKQKAELESKKNEISKAMRDQMKALGVKSVNTEFGTVIMLSLIHI